MIPYGGISKANLGPRMSGFVHAFLLYSLLLSKQFHINWHAAPPSSPQVSGSLLHYTRICYYWKLCDLHLCEIRITGLKVLCLARC